MSENIDEIEGIGPVYGGQRRAAGIRTAGDLLERCLTPADRKRLAAETGLSAKRILEWANLADLMRVSGIGRQYAELLEAAGVDTIKELRHRNADHLAAALAEVNEARHLSGSAPSVSMVAGWIEQAGTIEPKLTY